MALQSERCSCGHPEWHGLLVAALTDTWIRTDAVGLWDFSLPSELRWPRTHGAGCEGPWDCSLA